MNKIKVMPLGEFSYQTFPIYDEICFELTEEEIQKLIHHKLKWVYGEEEEIEVEDKTQPIYNDEREIIGYKKIKVIDPHATLVECDEPEENYAFEVEELKQYLADTDYVVIKINEAIIDGDEELANQLKTLYAPIIAQRKQARERIQELEN